jgi:uncharacterized protein YukE
VELVRRWRQEAVTKRRVARDLRAEADALDGLLVAVRDRQGPQVWVGRAADRFAEQLADAEAAVRAQQEDCHRAADTLVQQAWALDRRADEREEAIRRAEADALAAARGVR